jgi:hypothetical protein
MGHNFPSFLLMKKNEHAFGALDRYKVAHFSPSSKYSLSAGNSGEVNR